jgi:hypothetical protein
MTSVHDVAMLDIRQQPGLNFPWRPDIMAVAADIRTACDAFGAGEVTPSMLAAIVKRESGFRNIFQAGMPRGVGCGVGYCQLTSGVEWIDLDHPTIGGLDLTVPSNNFTVAVRDFLLPAFRSFPDSHQAAFDAYNLGAGGVAAELIAGESPDANTTDGNYGSDVFENWILYASINLGLEVDWTTWTPA